MKKILFYALLSLAFFNSNAQTNKPDVGSFGLQYGASYSGTLNQSLYLSGMLKKGWELRGGLQLTYSSNDNKSGDTSTMGIGNNTRVSGYSYSEAKYATLAITPNLAVLKHFKTPSNVDPFVGVQVSSGISFPTIPSQSISGFSSPDYSYETNRMTKNPLSVVLSFSVLGGVNYYVAKNFAIGIDAGLGFTSSLINGKTPTTTVNSNSGSLNHDTNSTTYTVQDSKINNYNFTMSGNGGLRFTYYIACGKHKPATETKM